MSFTEQVITIAMCVLGTMTTRFLPFLIFTEGRKTPDYVRYLGNALPAAIFGMLVVYCLRGVSISTGTHGIPELLGIFLTTVIHLWKRQMILSMVAGTLGYMVLVQYVFR